MSRLTGTVSGSAGQSGAGDESAVTVSLDPQIGPVNGVGEPDSPAVAPLPGQPPVAHGGNWWPPRGTIR